MPKTPMNENHAFSTWEHQVWMTGQPAAVQPIPKAERVNKATNGNFRLCVL
jgi:hypothetical protein